VFRSSLLPASFPTPPSNRLARRASRRCAAQLGLALLFAGAAASAPALAQSAISNKTAAVKINGEAATVEPAPVITRTGSVLVPLRGVLEKLGAQVNFVAAQKRIEVRQGGKVYVLREGQKSAVSGGQSVPLPAAPQRVGASVFVPLRALAELFGYRVEWDNAAKTVLINTDAAPVNTANHRAALSTTRRFGVGIDFTDATQADIPVLLDAAKAAGVDLIQTRFDWHTVQPAKGKPFDFSFYDLVVAEARKRNLVVVGILGNSAQWASLSRSALPSEWRYNAPRKAELPSWSLYVQRTVERFGRDVHAWQVWDQPTSWKLRASSFANYRDLAALAATAARKADANAVIHVAEPGGVNLNFLSTLKNDPAAAAFDGVRFYPASQWQPGLASMVEDQVAPFNVYQSQLPIGRDKWVGGLWFPALEGEGVTRPSGDQFVKVSDERRQQILADFSAQAQADYLLKTSALALANGADKIFWNALRDDAAYDSVEPINPEWGSGLLRRDNTPRPAYTALQTTSRLIGDNGFKFLGALANGPDIAALTFDNGTDGHVVAWSPSGSARIVVTDAEDPNVPGALYIRARAGFQVLDSLGVPLPQQGGAITLTNRPIWITPIAAQTAQKAKDASEAGGKYLQITRPLPRATDPQLARATFGDEGAQNGILWRKYQVWRGQANRTEVVGGMPTLVAETPPDIFRPADGKPYLFFDVADDFLFFKRSEPVTITVKMLRARGGSGGLTNNKSGFKIEYSSLLGPRSTRWQEVEAGEGWVEYSFDVPDAAFGNIDGNDFFINTFGSKQNLFFAEVSIQRRAANP
jgi:hypothetical protein